MPSFIKSRINRWALNLVRWDLVPPSIVLRNFLTVDKIHGNQNWHYSGEKTIHGNLPQPVCKYWYVAEPIAAKILAIYSDNWWQSGSRGDPLTSGAKPMETRIEMTLVKEPSMEISSNFQWLWTCIWSNRFCCLNSKLQISITWWQKGDPLKAGAKPMAIRIEMTMVKESPMEIPFSMYANIGL